MSQKADVGPDETFDIALNAVEKRAVRGLMKKSGADRIFRDTLSVIGGGDFSPAELRALEERVLDVADWGDVARLHGIEAGAPVVLSPNQKSTIDGLVGKLGSDALAKRVQGAYGDAFRTGKVIVH